MAFQNFILEARQQNLALIDEGDTVGNLFQIAGDVARDEDRVLLIDDFLARGQALHALIDLCEQAGATIVGAGVFVEKTYQGGGAEIRGRGVRVESLAKIKSMSVAEGIEFCD
jgi:xanthine phosphoribosyltransferase